MVRKKVWRQDFTKFLHTAVELRQTLEVHVHVTLLFMTPALYYRTIV